MRQSSLLSTITLYCCCHFYCTLVAVFTASLLPSFMYPFLPISLYLSFPITYCAAHVEYAKHYLPTGKGFRETGSDYIDYSNGSCMMHAAMENYFQKYYKRPGDNIKPDDILLTTLPGRPLTPDYDPSGGRAYGWCVPSITGWQMIEKVERYLKTKGITLFEKYPLDEFESYWTSDAETLEFEDSDGKTNAFVYQYGVGLDNVDNIMNYPSYLKLPRSTALKYRLINIPPKFLK